MLEEKNSRLLIKSTKKIYLTSLPVCSTFVIFYCAVLLYIVCLSVCLSVLLPCLANKRVHKSVSSVSRCVQILLKSDQLDLLPSMIYGLILGLMLFKCHNPGSG